MGHVVLVATMSRIAVVAAIVCGATVVGCYVEEYCVEGYSVGGCGVGGYYEARFYAKSVMDRVFWRIERMLLRNDRTM